MPTTNFTVGVRGVTFAHVTTAPWVATLALPAGTAAGDLLLVAYGGTYPTNMPAGWTKLQQQSASNANGSVAASIWYKFATSGDVSAGSVSIDQGVGNIPFAVELVALTNVKSSVAPAVIQTVDFSGATNSPGTIFAAVDAGGSYALGAAFLRIMALGDGGTGYNETPGYCSGMTNLLDTGTRINSNVHIDLRQTSGTSVLPSAQRTAGGYNPAGALQSVVVLMPRSNTNPTQPGVFTSPAAGATVDTTATVAWGASTDPDGDAVVYDVHLSTNNGASWTLIRNHQAGTSFTHDFTTAPATTTALLRATPYDTSGVAGTARTSSAFVIVHNVAPNAPTLTYPTGGVVLDRTASNRFSWTVNDPNGPDPQSKYDLRYKLTSSGTWTTVTGVTPSTFRDFASLTFPAGDYEWQVRTYDSGALVGAYSGSQFFTAATPPAGPTITSPTNGATVPTSTGVLVFSYPTLQARQVRKVADASGAADTTTVYFDTGTVEDPTGRDQALAFPVNNRAEHLQVRIRDGGLWSVWSSVRVEVDFTEPAVPILDVTAVDTTGLGRGTDALEVTITNPTPTGTQPVVTSTDLHRRETAGGGDGIPVARAVAGEWVDYGPGSGTAYEYQAVAHGANGVDITSEWTG